MTLHSDGVRCEKDPPEEVSKKVADSDLRPT